MGLNKELAKVIEIEKKRDIPDGSGWTKKHQEGYIKALESVKEKFSDYMDKNIIRKFISQNLHGVKVSYQSQDLAALLGHLIDNK